MLNAVARDRQVVPGAMQASEKRSLWPLRNEEEMRGGKKMDINGCPGHMSHLCAGHCHCIPWRKENLAGVGKRGTRLCAEAICGLRGQGSLPVTG